MTFTELVTVVTDQTNLSSTDAIARVGRRVNARYQRVCAEIHMIIAQRLVAQASTAGIVGDPVFQWSGMEKLERVYYTDGSNLRFLDEISFDDLRREEESGFDQADTPTKFAIQTLGPSLVKIRTNKKAATTYSLKADGLDTTDTLSGSQVPQFTTNFHYILAEGALADELRKMEQKADAQIAETVFEKGLSKLKLFVAQSAQRSGVSQQRGSGTSCRRCGLCA